MAKNTSISLGDHFEGFIQGQLNQGRYGSASEVVRAALRMLEEHERKLEALREAIRVGEESGISDKTTGDILRSVIERKRKNGQLPA